MKITEVDVELATVEDGNKLLAFCSITLDHCWVIHDLRLVVGEKGPFVSMPDRKIMAHCGKCDCKNFVLAKYCNGCGCKLATKVQFHDDGKPKLYHAVAHPISTGCRRELEQVVLEAYHKKCNEVNGEQRTVTNEAST